MKIIYVKSGEMEGVVGLLKGGGIFVGWISEQGGKVQH